ncbi:MAG: hydrogenase maturation protease [Betaproteobacteria bacterium]|nr:hydrogenase maturation protease [Betaproteobacteria bacterium]
MSCLYIFGLGSPYGWDQAGWLAAGELGTTFAQQPGIRVDTLSHPTSLFVHPVTSGDWLVFIDCMVGKATPGTVQRFTPQTLPSSQSQLSSHGFDLKSTVDLLTEMGFSAEHIQIFAVEAPAQSVHMEAQPLQLFLDQATRVLHGTVKTWVDEWWVTRLDDLTA